jgi:hypothetical protein
LQTPLFPRKKVFKVRTNPDLPNVHGRVQERGYFVPEKSESQTRIFAEKTPNFQKKIWARREV